AVVLIAGSDASLLLTSAQMRLACETNVAPLPFVLDPPQPARDRTATGTIRSLLIGLIQIDRAADAQLLRGRGDPRRRGGNRRAPRGDPPGPAPRREDGGGAHRLGHDQGVLGRPPQPD